MSEESPILSYWWDKFSNEDYPPITSEDFPDEEPLELPPPFLGGSSQPKGDPEPAEEEAPPELVFGSKGKAKKKRAADEKPKGVAISPVSEAWVEAGCPRMPEKFTNGVSPTKKRYEDITYQGRMNKAQVALKYHKIALASAKLLVKGHQEAVDYWKRVQAWLKGAEWARKQPNIHTLAEESAKFVASYEKAHALWKQHMDKVEAIEEQEAARMGALAI